MDSETPNPNFDYLEECPIDQRVPGQMYAVLSIVESDDKTKCALKIKGCFNSEDQARLHVQKIHKLDNRYNLFVVDMYKWLLLPPDLQNINDQEYSDNMLNSIIKGHSEQAGKAAEVFNDRTEKLKSGEETLDSLEKNVETDSTKTLLN